jgi:hypothetical protein
VKVTFYSEETIDTGMRIIAKISREARLLAGLITRPELMKISYFE